MTTDKASEAACTLHRAVNEWFIARERRRRHNTYRGKWTMAEHALSDRCKREYADAVERLRIANAEMEAVLIQAGAFSR